MQVPAASVMKGNQRPDHGWPAAPQPGPQWWGGEGRAQLEATWVSPAATLPSLHGMSEYPSLCDIRRTPQQTQILRQHACNQDNNISQLHLLKQYINKHRNATCCWALENKVSAAGLWQRQGLRDGQHDPAALPPALGTAAIIGPAGAGCTPLPPRATTPSACQVLLSRDNTRQEPDIPRQRPKPFQGPDAVDQPDMGAG